MNRFGKYVLCAALGVTTSAALAEDRDSMRKTSMDDVPRDARTALEQQTHDAKDVEVYKRVMDGKDFYTALYTEDGRRMEIRVDPEGKTVSGPHETRDQSAVQGNGGSEGRRDNRDGEPGDGNDYQRIAVTEADLPEPVRTAAQKEIEGGTNVDYYRLQRDGRDLYSVQFTPATGPRIDVRFDQHGEIVARHETLNQPADRARTASEQSPAEQPPAITPPPENNTDEGFLTSHEQVSVDTLPQAARDALRNQAAGAQDIQYYHQVRGGKDFYSAHFTSKNGVRFEVRVDPEGNIVSGPHESREEPIRDGADRRSN